MGRTNLKKKKIWTTQDEQLLLVVWGDRIEELRRVRQNKALFDEMEIDLKKIGCDASAIEIKNKIHNLTNKYRKEKSVFLSTGKSYWPIYSQVNTILGTFDTNNLNSVMDESINDSDVSNSTPAEFVICRACVKECTNFKSIYKFGVIRGEKTTLATLLTYCTNLDFSEQESSSLPGFICTNCLRDLSKSYLFKKRVLEADKMFRNQLNDNNSVESDDIQEQFDKEMDNLEDLDEMVRVKPEDDYVEYVVQEQMTSYDTVKIKEETNTEEVNKRNQKSDKHQSEFKKNQPNEKNKTSQVKVMYLNLKDLEKNQPDEKNKASKVKVQDAIDVKLNSDNENCFVNSLVKRNLSNIQFILCKICGKQFTMEDSFKYHMQLHLGGPLYKCNVCGKAFKTYEEFTKHKSKHAPNSCKICGKSYQQSTELSIHMKMHMVEQQTFFCHFCGKNFERELGYKMHMLAHARKISKPYTCDICGKAFVSCKSMKSHRENHYGLRKFRCMKCLERFPTEKRLNRHMLQHKKPLKCHLCFQAFTREISLRIHLRFHKEFQRATDNCDPLK